MDIEVESEKSEEEKPLLREKKMTEDQGSGSTHGEEEEESIVLHNRARPRKANLRDAWRDGEKVRKTLRYGLWKTADWWSSTG